MKGNYGEALLAAQALSDLVAHAIVVTAKRDARIPQALRGISMLIEHALEDIDKEFWNGVNAKAEALHNEQIALRGKATSTKSKS